MSAKEKTPQKDNSTRSAVPGWRTCKTNVLGGANETITITQTGCLYRVWVSPVEQRPPGPFRSESLWVRSVTANPCTIVGRVAGSTCEVEFLGRGDIVGGLTNIFKSITNIEVKEGGPISRHQPYVARGCGNNILANGRMEYKGEGTLAGIGTEGVEVLRV
jgi:hypothetical protein